MPLSSHRCPQRGSYRKLGAARAHWPPGILAQQEQFTGSVLLAVGRVRRPGWDRLAVIKQNAAPSSATVSSRAVCRCSAMRQWLIAIGIVLVAIGLLWPWLTRLGLGRLPGDIVVQRGGFSFYFPIVTCLIVSVVVSLILWLLNR